MSDCRLNSVLRGHVLRKVTGDRVLVLAVTGGHDVRRRVLVEEEVHNVEKALEVAILEVLADGDEVNGNASGETDSVLDIEVLRQYDISFFLRRMTSSTTHSLNTSLAAALRVRSAVERLEGKRGRRGDVRAIPREERPKVGLVGILLDEAGDREPVRRLGRSGRRDVVDRLQTRRGDSSRARRRNRGTRSQVLCGDIGGRREDGEVAPRVRESDRRVDEVEVALELGRDGVREGADGLRAGLVVRVDGEVGVEEVVGLADGDLKREPIAGRGDSLRVDVVLLQPSVDGIYAFLRGRDELLNLFGIGAVAVVSAQLLR